MVLVLVFIDTREASGLLSQHEAIVARHLIRVDAGVRALIAARLECFLKIIKIMIEEQFLEDHQHE